MTTAEELRSLPLFEKVSESELADLAALGSEVVFAPGDELWTQNLPAECWWVLLEGRIDLVRTFGHEETVLGAMDAPGRWAGGFRAWDELAVYLATGRGAADGRVLRVPADCSSTDARPDASEVIGARIEIVRFGSRLARAIDIFAVDLPQFGGGTWQYGLLPD